MVYNFFSEMRNDICNFHKVAQAAKIRAESGHTENQSPLCGYSNK
jgi:hypothetical protein